jgi:crossover junction endodeoxyribonuclease RusA
MTLEELQRQLEGVISKNENAITLTLPWPPSVNKYWRTFQGRMIISAEGRSYRKAVADQVLIQRGAKHYTGKLRVQIEAFRPDNRRRDLDNLLKAVLDGCTHAGVWEDDSNIVDLRIYWADTVGGMLKVKVSEV